MRKKLKQINHVLENIKNPSRAIIIIKLILKH